MATVETFAQRNGSLAIHERLPARLRVADPAGRSVAQSAGPFEIAEEPRNGVGGALMTGLLVFYPVFATVAAIGAGLYFGGISGA